MTSKKVLFTTTAGTGHFLPMVPLAQELVKLGCTVKVAGPESFKSQVDGVGLDFLPFDDVLKDDPRVGEIFAKAHERSMDEMQELVGKIVFGLTNTEAALPKMEDIFTQYVPDMVISETGEFSGPILSLHKEIPFVRFSPSLAVSDTYFVKHAIEGIEPILAERKITSEEFTKYIHNAPFLTYFPKSIEDSSYTEPNSKTFRLLHQSLENGPVKTSHQKDIPKIYVTFGTVASQLGFYPRIFNQIIDGLRNLPVEVLVTIGKNADPKQLENVPSNIEVLQWKDQEEALKDSSIVICHVGSGTMLGSLAFGLPIIAVPLFADQFMNASRIVGANVGLVLEANDDLPNQVKQSVEKILETKINSKEIASEMAKQIPVKAVAQELLNMFQ